MNTFNIDASDHSPRVILDAGRGLLEIKGNSTLEPAAEFYRQLEKWIHAFNLADANTRIVNFMLDDVNSQSVYWLQHVMQQLEKLHKTRNANMVVNWYYTPANEKILRTGRKYLTTLHLPINLVAA